MLDKLLGGLRFSWLAFGLHLLRLSPVLTQSPAMTDDDAVESFKLPFCRKGHSTVEGFLDKEHFLIVFGGKGLNYKESGTRWLNDLWTLTLDTSDLTDIRFVWMQREDLISTNNAQRWGYGLASNTLGGVMLVGGMDSDSSLYLNDSWLWLPSSRGWMAASPSSPWLGTSAGPCPRVGLVVLSFPKEGVAVLIGGETAHRDSRHRDEVACLSDAYSIRTGPVLASLSGEGVADSDADISWRRLADMPGPCLLNSASVAVSMGGRDLIFRFGGSHLGGKKQFFSSTILLYDLAEDSWQVIAPPYGSSIWPPGRDRHAIAYSRKVFDLNKYELDLSLH